MSSTPVPKVVEAQQFLVRDEAGKIRVALGALNSWGEPVLSLHDENGVPRVYIELVDGYPSLRFMRPDGNPLFCFGKTESGSPILSVSRSDATPALLVIAENGVDVKVGLCSRDGEPIWLDASFLQVGRSGEKGEKGGEKGGGGKGDTHQIQGK